MTRKRRRKPATAIICSLRGTEETHHTMGSFREEFMRTERTLARHPAAIKERLIDAAKAGIAALHGNERELAKMPTGLRKEFSELMADLTKAGGSRVQGEGSI